MGLLLFEWGGMGKLRILLVSTPVGALGSGLGGGVELTLANLAKALQRRGHELIVLAPAGSVCPGVPLILVPGQLQTTAQTQGRDAPITMPGDCVLAQAWDMARQQQTQFDVILNFAYDWLPFYLTPFFTTPIAHLVSMGSLTDAMDQIIGQVALQQPGSIGVHSQAQAETFTFAAHCRVLGNGFDLSQYQFQPEPLLEPQPELGWVGRIAPEKGLEDAAAAVAHTGTRLKVWGAMQYPDYWAEVQADYPQAQLSYEGFLSTQDLQQQLGQCQGLLMTPKWVEAFGNVAIEALACGVPVVAYRRGGPAEIVEDGITGWLVAPDDVEGLRGAIAKLPQIHRQTCRHRAETHYSLAAMGERVEDWLLSLLGR